MTGVGGMVGPTVGNVCRARSSHMQTGPARNVVSNLAAPSNSDVAYLPCDPPAQTSKRLTDGTRPLPTRDLSSHTGSGM